MKHIAPGSGAASRAFPRTGKTFLLTALVSAAAIAAGTASADTSGALSQRDRAFVDEAAQAGIGEVALGERAEQHAASPRVREFAARIVNDHAKLNAELH